MNNTLTLPGIDGTPRDTRLVLDMLSRITHGTLDVHMPDGTRRLFGHGEHAIALEVRNEAMFARVLARGDIGLAEAYLEGEWDCTDITGLLRQLARNREPLRSAVYGRWRHLLAARIRHLLNGWIDSYLYLSGRIDTTLPFQELRRRSHINERARAAGGSLDFSDRIRAGLPSIDSSAGKKAE